MRAQWVSLIFLSCGLVSVSFSGMNPANPGFPRVDLFGESFDNNNYSSVCVKCHERIPGVHVPPLDNTAWGTHFVYGGSTAVTRNTSWEKTDAWPSGGVSRYGKTGDNVSQAGARGELICESCHNLKVNTGSGKLIVTDNLTTDPSALCEGCHARTGPGHHLLSGEQSSIDQHNLSNANGPSVRNPPTTNSGVTYPGVDAINCRSCHSPHKGQTKTGARILKRGWKSLSNPGDAVNGAGVTGVERQFDIGPAGIPLLVTDFTPLCDACHTAGQ